MADQDFELKIRATADTSGVSEMESKLRGLSTAPTTGFPQPGGIGPVPKELLGESGEPFKAAADGAEKTAEATGLIGANLTRARQEAIVLVRELATGAPTTRTLGSLLGSLVIPIAAAGVAGIGLVEVMKSVADQADKVNSEVSQGLQRIQALAASLDQAAAKAVKPSEVRAVASESAKAIQEESNKVSELQNKHLGFWASIGSTITRNLIPEGSGLSQLFGLKGAAFDPLQKNLDKAVERERANLELTKGVASGALQTAVGVERSVEAQKSFAEAARDTADKIDDLQKQQESVNVKAEGGTQRYDELGRRIDAARSKLFALIEAEQKREQFQKAAADLTKQTESDLSKRPDQLRNELVEKRRRDEAATQERLSELEGVKGKKAETERAELQKRLRTGNLEDEQRVLRDLNAESIASRNLAGDTLEKQLGTEGANLFRQRRNRIREIGGQLGKETGSDENKEVVLWLQKIYQQWQ
jgi:hypothetical protein